MAKEAKKRKTVNTTERVEVVFTANAKHYKEGAKANVHPELAKTFKERGLIK